MKGIVFVELLRMAESVIGEAAVDDILDSLDLTSGGAYTSVGNYPCDELMVLVRAFSSHTGTPEADLQQLFGRWMHTQFVTHYPGFFEGKRDALVMLGAIEDEVHVEVRKLYPDAELPSFSTEHLGPDGLRMTYRSPRPLSDFCHGLVAACVDHFGRPADIARRDLDGQAATVSEFTITFTE